AIASQMDVGICYWASYEIHSVRMETSEQALGWGDPEKDAAAERRNHVKQSTLRVCFILFLVHGTIYAQDSSTIAERGDREQVYSRPSLLNASPPRRGDIVADNLDRVAATTEQILEILNRDAGLMVELKRWIAEDAGESGQVLEESDLTNSAVVK